MITLTLGTDPLPPILTTGFGYDLSVFVDGETPLQAEWSVWTTSPFASGTGPLISFTPVTAATTYINVLVVKKNGQVELASFTVQALAPATEPIEVWIVWGQLRYAKGDTLEAQFRFRQPQGLGYKSLSWALYRNSIWQASGTSTSLKFLNAEHGVYRLVAHIVDYAGNTITGDSSVVITGDFEVQSSLKPEAASTMQLLGTVYTGEQISGQTFSTGVAMPLSAMAEEIYLIPGTTHFLIELETDGAVAPDQIVARTPTGNWSVRGFSPGSITLPYEFLDNDHFIPAPADLRLRISTESFAASAGTVDPFNFRLRLKCFYGAKQVFEFKPCVTNSTEGGSGLRARRFTVLMSDVDLLTDADTTLERIGAPATSLRRYTTDFPTVLPVPASVDGAPDVPNRANRLFYTDQNWITAYDPADEGLLEVDAHSTYAIEATKPFVISYMMPAYPTVVQRLRRVTGKAAVYMANGFLNSGASVTISVLTAGGYSSQAVSVPVTEDVASPDLETYVKVGEVNVDISDAEFIDNGLVGFIAVDESGAQVVSWPAGTNYPDPGTLPNLVYSPNTALYARLDGACYYRSALASVLNGTATSDTGTAFPLTADIVACYDPVCGPVGMFCYGETNNGPDTMTVPQPLYNPAPVVVPASQLTRCFCNPCLVTPWVDPLPAYPDFVAYQDNTYCGVAWAFIPCSGTGTPLAVPYPDLTVPPDVISYAGTCWSNQGILGSTTGYALVDRNAVTPVFDCQDVICTGSDPNGMIVRYRDGETDKDVDVYFDHLDNGIPNFAVIPQSYDSGDNGLTSGRITFTAHQSFEGLALTVAGTGRLLVNVAPSGYAKDLIVYRSGASTVHSLPVGIGDALLSVLPGDQVALRLYTGQRLHFEVSWKPFVGYPKAFQSGTINGTTSIRSIGFTGLTSRSTYAFYGTLPADVTLSEVNPDSILTVTTQGTEYVLIRARAQSDSVPVLPFNSVWYSGTDVLAGPLVFRLYGGRRETGEAGEMDVWLDNDGSFPSVLTVSQWKALVKYGDPPRRSGLLGDVTRNSLRVTADPATFYQYPCAYVASGGDRIVVAGTYRPLTRMINGTLYTFAGTCPGLAYATI